MSDTIQLLAFSMVLGTVLIVFAMKYISAALVSRSLAKHANAYSALAQKVAATEAATQISVASIQTELSGIAVRLSTIAKILEEVE